jgi:hypothetical protein
MTKQQLSLLIIPFFISLATTAQTTTIKSQVTTFDVIKVMQAEVTAKKGKVIVLTDSLGMFTIECDLKDKLLIKAVGFKSKTIKVKKAKDLEKINLEIAGSESEIDMAVAKGHIKETSAAEAKKQYKTKKPIGYGYNNMTDLMKAKFPQFKISIDEIVMRGQASLTGSTNKGALLVLNGATYNWGSVKNLDVRTVKNIKILSGTAANRYGSGSGNGVILIELISE